MYTRDRDLMRNGSGYFDPTAYEAIKNIDKKTRTDKNSERFYKLLHTIFHVCELAGFRIEGRIRLVDTRTGRIWE
jgi:hypothetical protein